MSVRPRTVYGSLEAARAAATQWANDSGKPKHIYANPSPNIHKFHVARFRAETFPKWLHMEGVEPEKTS